MITNDNDYISVSRSCFLSFRGASPLSCKDPDITLPRVISVELIPLISSLGSSAYIAPLDDYASYVLPQPPALSKTFILGYRTVETTLIGDASLASLPVATDAKFKISLDTGVGPFCPICHTVECKHSPQLVH